MSHPVYSDLDPEFRTRKSGEILVLEDNDALDASIENIMSLQPGEKLMNPEWGSELSGMLSEPVNTDTATFLSMAIRNALKSDPRIEVDMITVTPKEDANSYEVIVSYKISATGSRATFQKEAKWE